MPPFGYVRQSVTPDPTKTYSPAVQRERIQDLAAAKEGKAVAATMVVLQDLDVSGAKVEERRHYMELVAAIESGEATSVYALDLSRLHRNTEEALRFFRLAAEHGVPVRLVNDSIDTSGPTGELILTVLAAMNAWVSKSTSAKIKAALARRRAEGHKLGPRMYGEVRKLANGKVVGADEDPQAIVAAFREAGSYDGAAKLLNDRGVPCRSTRGKKRVGYMKGGVKVTQERPERRDPVWYGTTVRDIVQRVAPDLMVPRAMPADGERVPGAGAKAGFRDYRLARLLVCSVCGSLLTPSVDKRRGEVRYYCHRAKVTPHGRGWIIEAKVMPLVKDEADHAAMAMRRIQKGNAADDAALASLQDKRERVIDSFHDGVIDKAGRDRRLADIAAQAAKFSGRRWARQVGLPPMLMDHVDDDGTVTRGHEPAKVNAYLRRLFTRVTVDMSQPARRGPNGPVPGVTFDWRDPSLRGDTAA